MFLSILGLPNYQAINITACNCSQPQLLGAINMSDVTSCESGIVLALPQQVNYVVLSNRKEKQTFPGIVCSKWKESHTFTTFFLGGWNLDKEKVEIPVTSTECAYMHTTLNCGENTMTPVPRTEKTWSHDARPQGGPNWPWTTSYIETNCMVKEIILEQECENCTIISPLGSLGNNAAARQAIFNHLTFVWNDFTNKKSQCTLHQIAQGTAQLHKKNGNQFARLRDVSKQLDFLLLKPEQSPCSSLEGNISRIRGSDNIFVHITTFVKDQADDDTRPISELLVAHMQYEDDRQIDRLNVLAQEITDLDCQSRQNKVEQLILTAQQDGLLAARQLGLRLCQTVSVNKLTAIVFQCGILQVDITTEVTKCGPQPRYKNYSISHNGWSLTPFSSCRFTTGVVPLNDNFYRSENGTWTPVEANIKLSHQKLIERFGVEADDALRWIPHGQPTHDLMVTDQLNVMSDIISAMKENDITSFSQMVIEESFWSNPIETIKNLALKVVMIFTTFILFLVLFVVIFRTSFCKRVSTCIRITACPKTVNEHDVELQELRPPENL